jgi:hypothetical protein
VLAAWLLRACDLWPCTLALPQRALAPSGRRPRLHDAEEISQDRGSPMYCQMTTVVQAFLAFLAVLLAMGHSEASTPAFAGVADPAARSAFGEMQRGLQKLADTVLRQERELEAQRAHSAALEARLGEAEATLSKCADHEDGDDGGTFRRAQEVPQDNTTVVHLHRASVLSVDPPGMGRPPNHNGGHRRTQKAGVCGNFAARTDAVNVECCNGPSEDCSSGTPATCNAGCAGVFLPFWTDCGSQMPTSASLLPVVALCQAAAAGGGSTGAGMCNATTVPAQLCPSGTPCPHCGSTMCACPSGPDPSGGGDLVHQFNLVCVDSAVDNCVPACSAALRGDLLLMNLNGEDSKYSCEVHHGLHSWVGAATDGGYLGSDARAFVSAVLSGAAGYYALTLLGDAGITVDVTIRPGQIVRITGDGTVPSWGSGSFAVQPGASLTLDGVTAAGDVSVMATGTLHLNQMLWRGQTLTASTTESGGLQCFAPYSILSDSWRATSAGGGSHCDKDAPEGTTPVTGVGGGRWYRFRGSAGDALPLASPGRGHCGTDLSGWLSGWSDPGNPLDSYSGQGQYPTAKDGVMAMTVCFDAGNHPCNYHVLIGAVRCQGFLLWQLPDVPHCIEAYCTVSSGL